MTADPRTILVVDDEILIAMLAAAMIADFGYRVIEANSAAQALGILKSDQRIDLLVSDYSMPSMSGVELASRARDLRPRLPVLLASGYTELPKGASDDLPRIGKPFSQEELGAAIGKLLNPTEA
jgi:CheY-like chemotaxis protein